MNTPEKLRQQIGMFYDKLQYIKRRMEETTDEGYKRFLELDAAFYNTQLHQLDMDLKDALNNPGSTLN